MGEEYKIKFDGSVLGTVEFADGREIDVLVCVDPSPRGSVDFDAMHEHDGEWVAAHRDELEDVWSSKRWRS